MTTRAGIGVFEYVSPMWRRLTPEQKRVRRIAYDLREGRSVDVAAVSMAPYVAPHAALVPVPSSRGERTHNLALSRALAELVRDAVVLDALRRRTPVESSRVRRLRGRRGLSVLEHGLVKARGVRVPSDREVVFIDNVMTTGTTFEAARRALGTGSGLAFAEVRRTPVPL